MGSKAKRRPMAKRGNAKRSRGRTAERRAAAVGDVELRVYCASATPCGFERKVTAPAGSDHGALVHQLVGERCQGTRDGVPCMAGLRRVAANG